MPAISVEHVVSCSSADPNNPAENLLKADGTHKWKGQLAGEKSVSVVLQFSKSSQIHSVDIGNEGSAFVEILVGKATASADKDFEVLLVASSFMSPLESRNGTNKNSVRMFGTEKLNKMTSSQKWDRVKIVCSQPFSKLQQYGLSFIKFHSPPGGDEKETKVKKFGAFTLKNAEDDDDDIKIGSAFAKRSEDEPAVTPKAAAAVRAATRLIEEKQTPVPGTSKSPNNEAQKRRATSPPLAYNNNLKPKVPKVTVPQKDEGSDTDEDTEVKSRSKPVQLKKQSTSLSSVASSHSTKSDKRELKKTKTLPPHPSPSVAFGKLMEKVVFVLSGFQNPYRGELRDKAMEMGATYKPDWGRGCTHLICAFDNTPKYQHVRGKGRIVTKKWILDCSKQTKLLPWRKYRLGDAPSPDQSSDEEEEPQQKDKPYQRQSSNSTPQKTNRTNTKVVPKKGGPMYDDSGSDSDPDTEEEIQKANEEIKKRNQLAEKKKVTPKVSPHTNPDPYDEPTDDEQPDTLPLSGDNDEDGSDSGLPQLPDFFTDKHFFFYGDMNKNDKKLLTRYIAAYNGEIEEYMSSKVNFVVTPQKWDSNFDDALSENSSLIFVRPKWIYTCHEQRKYVPYQRFIVSQ